MKSIWILWCLLLPLALRAQVNLTSSNLPIILITSDSLVIPDEPKITATMQVIDQGPGQLNHPTDPPNDYVGYIGIERRGSSSQDLSDKKPYAVETRNADGSDRKFPLLGMPEEADWAFLAPFNDKSLVRDALMLELAREIMPWAARTRFVELVLNGQYQGIYMVTEKIKRDANRVNIDKLKSNDLGGDTLTGGYIIKLDKLTGATIDGWTSPYPPIAGTPQVTYYQYDYPKPENITPEQKQYIQQWMTDFEVMAKGFDFNDTLIGYPEYLDVPSFIDFVLLNEMAKNVDAYRLSTYFWKDRDSKDPRLHAGPVWDFNIALGNADYCAGADYRGWAIDFNQICPNDNWVIHFWWTRLWIDQNFRRQMRDRWLQLRAEKFSDASILAQLDSMTNLLQESQVRNFHQWPILNTWVWPNVFCCGLYTDHTQYLRTWLLNRLHWMDDNVPALYVGFYYPEEYFPPIVVPNPSYGKVTFQYYVHHHNPVLIQVYDQTGRFLTELTDVPLLNGENEFVWEYSLSQGVYFFTVNVNGKVESTGKFVVGPY